MDGDARAGGFRPIAFRRDDTAPAHSPFPPLHPDPAAPPPEQDRMRQLEAMLQEMQGRAEIIEKEAWDKAWAAGEKAGMELGRRRAEQMLAEIEALRDALAADIARLRAEAADALVDLAAAMAERLIGQTLASRPEWLAELAAEAARRLAPETGLTLRAPPETVEALRTLLADDAAIGRIEPDPSLPAGQCRIEGDERAAILDPAGALQTLAAALKQEANGGAAPAQGPSSP